MPAENIVPSVVPVGRAFSACINVLQGDVSEQMGLSVPFTDTNTFA